MPLGRLGPAGPGQVRPGPPLEPGLLLGLGRLRLARAHAVLVLGDLAVRTHSRSCSWCTVESMLVKALNSSSPGAITGARTMWSSSSIQTTDGTFVIP